MSEKIKIITDVTGAPKPVGPYSIATISSGLAFLSGQVPIDPATGALVTGGIEAEAKQVLKNINAVLSHLGLSWSDVVKTTIFMIDLKNFQVVNSIYGETMGEHRPSRSTIQVAALPLGAAIEIEMIVAVK